MPDVASAPAMTGMETDRYTRTAVALHWIIAALIVANLALGFFHDDFSKASRANVMTLHKSFGFTVLALSVARLLWRLGHRPPRADAVLKRWEATLAALTQWVFYGLMIALPLTGWVLSSGGGRATNFYWLVRIPALGVSKATGKEFGAIHEYLGWGMLVLLLLHIAGALTHQLQGHRQVLGRMAPWMLR
jgi:cytochrome b561